MGPSPHVFLLETNLSLKVQFNKISVVPVNTSLLIVMPTRWLHSSSFSSFSIFSEFSVISGSLISPDSVFPSALDPLLPISESVYSSPSDSLVLDSSERFWSSSEGLL